MADQHSEIVKQEMENGCTANANGALLLQEERGAVIWNYVLTNRLIELWQEKPYLYDINTIHYKDKNMKARALEEIADKMGMTVEDVKAKIKGVRSQFVREKKRLRDCTEEDPRPRWPHYSKLTFLENFIMAKPVTSASKKDQSEEEKDWMDYEDTPHDYFGNREYQAPPQPVVVEQYIEPQQFIEPQPVQQTPPPPPAAPQVSSYSNSPRPPKRFKKKSDEDTIVRRYLSLIDKVDKAKSINRQEVETKTDDDDEIFCKYIATELRTIPDPHVKRAVKLQIHQAIFKAHSTVQTLPHTVPQPSDSKQRQKNYTTTLNHDDIQHDPVSIYYPMNDEDLASTSVPSLFTDRGSTHMPMGNGEVQ